MLMVRLLALICAILLAGCNAPDEQWPSPAPAPSPALWQVTAPSGEQGWLFGTVHALPDGVAWRTPKQEQALAAAGVLVVEIANPGDPAGQALFERLSTTRGQPPLSRRVGTEDRPSLLALMERAEVDDGQFASTESWGAALLLAGAVRQGDPANGVDRALVADAGEVIALETLASQFAMFDTLPQTDQSALLAATAREAASTDPQAAIKAWLTGDLAALERLNATSLLAHPGLRERLLTSRNRAWAEQIEAIIGEGSRPFVAVGAAHLIGPDGLPALLEARGYTVERVQ